MQVRFVFSVLNAKNLSFSTSNASALIFGIYLYYSLRPIFFVLFEKSNFLREYYLLSCLSFKKE